MGDAFQERVGIERAVQPVEPIDPQLDCLWCCRAGRLLEAIEAGGRAVGRLGSARFPVRPHARLSGVPDQDVKDPPMNFRAKSIHQPVERAERGKVDRAACNASIARLMRSAGSLMVCAASKRGAADQSLASPWWRRKDASGLPPGSGTASLSLRSSSGETGGIQSICDADRRPCQGGFRQVSRSSRGPGGSSAGLRAACARCRPRGARMKAKSVSLRLYRAPKLFSGQPRTRPRVRSAVDGRHGVSRKGFAEAAGGSV